MNFKMGVFALLMATRVVFADTAVEQLETAIQNKHYDQAGKVLQKNLGKSLALVQVKMAAEKLQDRALQSVVTSTSTSDVYKEYGISKGEFAQIALFFETEIDAVSRKYKTNYLTPAQTNLPYIVEWDPELKTKFIVLEGKKAYIGQGKKKIVTAAIMYGPKPVIVARGEQSIPMERELKITKLLQKAPGVFETYGFGEHKSHGKKYTTIYSKLYRSGSLQKVFDDRIHLRMHQKMKIAANILRGLNSLHSRGFVHRDLGARNYLASITPNEVDAVVADLGRTGEAKRAAHSKVQGNTTYTAPEGLFLNKMRGNDYFKSDVYAVGCVLYQLFYDKKPVWQDHSYVKDVRFSLTERYKELVQRITMETGARKLKLLGKAHTPREQFELLVLLMVSPDPKMRPTAQMASVQMDAIVKKELE